MCSKALYLEKKALLLVEGHKKRPHAGRDSPARGSAGINSAGTMIGRSPDPAVAHSSAMASHPRSINAEKPCHKKHSLSKLLPDGKYR